MRKIDHNTYIFDLPVELKNLIFYRDTFKPLLSAYLFIGCTPSTSAPTLPPST